MSKGYGLDFVQTPEIVRRYSFRVLPLTIVDGTATVQRVRILAADSTPSDRFFVVKIFSARTVLATGNAAAYAAMSFTALNPVIGSFISGSTNNPGNNAAVLAFEKGYLPFVDIPLAYAFTGGVDVDLYANLVTSNYSAQTISAVYQYEALIALIV